MQEKPKSPRKLRTAVIIAVAGVLVIVIFLFGGSRFSHADSREVSAATLAPSGRGPEGTGTKGSSHSDRSERELWHGAERDRETYLKSFVPDPQVATISRIWFNTPIVRFWTDRLSSGDPEQAHKAIQVLERAAKEPGPGEDEELKFKRGADGADPVLRYDSLVVRGMMDTGYTSLLGSRSMANSALETAGIEAGDEEGEARILSNTLFSGDMDDSQILRDALPVIKAFAPRLQSGDPEVAKAAQDVLSMVTFHLFQDKDASWWNSQADAIPASH